MPIPPSTPAHIREITSSFQASRVILTGVDLGVFTVLAEHSLTSADVAARVSADPRALDRLMNALVAIGLLHKAGERFSNSELAALCLVKGRPGYMAGLQHTSHMWERWCGLTEAVRSGGPHGGDVKDRGPVWFSAFIDAMHWRAQPQAAEIAQLLSLEGVRRVVDVGGGSGAFSIAFARAEPALHAVVFDLPNVVPLTLRYVAEAGLADRITTMAGDYTRDPLPGDADLVFLSAIVHSNTGEENAELLRKAAGALRPGGRVCVLDWIMSADRTVPLTGALFALNMLVGTRGGDTYTEDEVRSWFATAGLRDVQRKDTSFDVAMLVGSRK